MPTRLARTAVTLTAAVGLVVVTVSSAQAVGRPGPPSYDDFSGMPEPGIPTGFLVMMFLVGALGVGGAIWRVSLARQMASESGMDPDRATAVTLLSDDGLEATYLASSLKGGGTPRSPVDEVPRARSAQERLRELQQLREEGLVTEAEYDARRKAILDSI